MESILLNIFHKGRSTSLHFKRNSKYDSLIDSGNSYKFLILNLIFNAISAMENFGIYGENIGGLKLIDDKGYLLTKDLFEHIISVTKKKELTFHLQGNANYLFINNKFFVKRSDIELKRRNSDVLRSFNNSLHEMGSPVAQRRRSLGKPNVRI